MYLPTYVCAFVKSNVEFVAPSILAKVSSSSDCCHWYVKPVIDPSTSAISLVSAVSV